MVGTAKKGSTPALSKPEQAQGLPLPYQSNKLMMLSLSKYLAMEQVDTKVVQYSFHNQFYSHFAA